MTLDILVVTLPYLSLADSTSLFDLCLQSNILESKDNAAQKRGYKILTRLVESQKIPIDVQATLQKLEKLVDGLTAAAKKVTINSSVSHSLLCYLLFGILGSLPPTLSFNCPHPIH